MIWAILFLPIFSLFYAILQLLSYIPINYPSGIHDAFQYFNGFIWQFNGVFPFDTLFQIFWLVLIIEGFFILMWVFGWHAKKIPGIN